jgi:hypothetical protein
MGDDRVVADVLVRQADERMIAPAAERLSDIDSAGRVFRRHISKEGGGRPRIDSDADSS